MSTIDNQKNISEYRYYHYAKHLLTDTGNEMFDNLVKQQNDNIRFYQVTVGDALLYKETFDEASAVDVCRVILDGGLTYGDEIYDDYDIPTLRKGEEIYEDIDTNFQIGDETLEEFALNNDICFESLEEIFIEHSDYSGGTTRVYVEKVVDDDDDDDVEEFKCEQCSTVEGRNMCELCDEENVCEDCYGQGGDYGSNEIWVCHECLPTWLKCESKLYTADNECCGKGRSDEKTVTSKEMRICLKSNLGIKHRISKRLDKDIVKAIYLSMKYGKRFRVEEIDDD